MTITRGLPLEITTDKTHVKTHAGEFYRLSLVTAMPQQWVRIIGHGGQLCQVSGEMFRVLGMRLPWQIVVVDHEPVNDVYEVRLGDLKSGRTSVEGENGDEKTN